MQPIKCPHCGAPPPQPIYPTGQFSYHCVYCKQTSLLGAPPQQPPPQTGQHIIVVHAHHDHDDDHDDHFHQAHQAHISAANAAHRISWMVWVAVVLFVSLGGGAFGFSRCGKHSALVSALVWSGDEPITCTGNDDIAVSGVEASFTSGTAISATGNCHFRCTDCNISAPTAIDASGNAQITIINGTIKGTAILADASGNAHVNISGNVTASGRVRENGNAKVSAPPPPPPPATATATAAPAPTARPSAAPTAPTKGSKPAPTPAKAKTTTVTK